MSLLYLLDIIGQMYGREIDIALSMKASGFSCEEIRSEIIAIRERERRLKKEQTLNKLRKKYR